MSLPSDTELVPAVAASLEHPPIYLKLTPSLLASLLDAPRSGEPAMSLRIDSESSVASLRVGQATFEGSILREPSGLDAYLPDQKGNFVNVGRVQDKINLRPKSNTPPASSGSGNGSVTSTTNSATKRQAEESRIMHLLALGPNTPGGLANQSSMPLDTVKAVLADWGVSKGADMYTLKPQGYEKLRIGEFKHYKTRDRQKVAQDALKAFATLGYDADHPAHRRVSAVIATAAAATPAPTKKTAKSRAKSKSPPTEAATATASSTTTSTASTPDPKPKGKSESKVTKADPKATKAEPRAEARVAGKTEPKSAKTEPKTAKTESKVAGKEPRVAGKEPRVAGKEPPRASGKEKVAKSEENVKLTSSGVPETGKRKLEARSDRDDKRLRHDDDTDPHALARRFRHHYTEYLQLYSALSKRKTRPPLQVQKLLKMHRELEGWKQALWKRAGRGSSKSVA